jgi:hypothetical protein
VQRFDWLGGAILVVGVTGDVAEVAAVGGKKSLADWRGAEGAGIGANVHFCFLCFCCSLIAILISTQVIHLRTVQ